MHIKDILNEDNTALSPYKIYNEITARQANLLHRLENNEIDPFEVSDKTEKTLQELLDLQLIDSAYDLTSLGKKILKISYDVAPKERRDASMKQDAKRAMNRKEKPELNVNDVEDADMDDDDTLPEPEGEDVISLEAKPKKRKGTGLKRMEPDRDVDFDHGDVKMDDDNEYQWD